MEDINAQDVIGWTSLHHAVTNRDFDKVKTLLQSNADPSIRSNYGNTPLHETMYRSVFIVSLLLDYQTLQNMSIANKNGESPLDMAVRYQLKTHATLIYDAGGKVIKYKQGQRPWFDEFVRKRRLIKSTLVHFFALSKRTKAVHKDLVTVIAKMVWEKRDDVPLWGSAATKKNKQDGGA